MLNSIIYFTVKSEKKIYFTSILLKYKKCGPKIIFRGKKKTINKASKAT